jgi:xylose isomerase
MRHAVLTPFFGQLRDRFATYHAAQPIGEKLRRASSIPGVEGVEVIFPDEVRNAGEIREDLASLGLSVAAVNVNLKGERAFQHGALSSPDAGVRGLAVDLLCQGKELAADLGTRVTCAPLADGYDYAFQVDYRRVWSRAVECVAAAGAFRPEVVLHLEHKPAEPRTRGLLDVPAKVLLLCRDVATPNVGITFNTGHAACAGTAPAAAFADVLAAGVPYYVHICDATTAWDWDLGVGTQHPWLWAEFLFWLRYVGYDGWLTADTFPVRQDPCDLFAANIAFTARVCRWLDSLDEEAMMAHLEQQRALPMLRALEQWLPRPA